MNVKSLLRSLTPPILYQALHAARLQLATTTEYAIGRHLIRIPADHNLPSFQAAHRLYDRFLPVLCEQLPADGVIVDVGANVGDTVAAVLQVCGNPIVAIEGHPPYFDILTANLERIDPNQRVKAVQTLVGTGRQSGKLVATRGTATLKAGSGSRMRTLDDVLADQIDNIVLLKVDTDGFDADVILSGARMIAASQPLLFWESGTSGATTFDPMYEMIADRGYDTFWIFDNFGNLILGECSTRELKDFDRYIESVYRYRCTTAIYYVDVLASSPRSLATARAAVTRYRSEFIEVADTK